MNLLQDVRVRRGWYLISAGVVVLDQLSKVAAHAWLPGKGMVTVIPGFLNLWYSRNPGGLFGFFGSWGQPWRMILLTLFPILAIGLIALFLAQTSVKDRATLFGLSCILGGAAGNLIDRVFRGEVIDFLDVYASAPSLAEWFTTRFGTAHWPTFNVADTAIVTGACLLVLDILRSGQAADAVKES
jgi:signal peptidase II